MLNNGLRNDIFDRNEKVKNEAINKYAGGVALKVCKKNSHYSFFYIKNQTIVRTK